MRLMRKTAAMVLALLLAFFMGIHAFAADGNVTYSGDAGEFIFAPGSEYSPTDLFPDFKDVMPGDSISQRIRIQNDASKNVKIKVYMRSLGAHPDAEAFLSQLHLQVEKVTDTVMFDAAAHETAQLAQWVCLGTLYSGGVVELDVILDVPVSLDNTNKEQIGYLDWQFMIEELPVEPQDPEPPKTGDTFPVWLLILTLATSGAVLVVLLIFRRKEKHKAR